MNRLLIELIDPEHVVLSQMMTMVTGKEDQSVLGKSKPLQIIQYIAKDIIRQAEEAQVRRPCLAMIGLRGIPRQLPGDRLPPVGRLTLGGDTDIRRQVDCSGIIHAGIRFRYQ